MAKIKKIKAREILDSRGNPTVEVDLIADAGVFRASAPAGVSKGRHEAVELRDGGKRYEGRGVLKAVKNVNEIIAPNLIGKDPTKQKEIDALMIELDGRKNKSKLGANAILPVSIAVCRAGAKAENLPLYRHLQGIYQSCASVNNLTVKEQLEGLSPVLLMIEGGLHAGNDLDIQEFMIVPESEQAFSEKLRMGTEIYHILGSLLKKEYGSFATNVGYEGGFAPPLRTTAEVLNLIKKAIVKSGHENKIKIVLDVASSTFYQDKAYKFEGVSFTREGLLNFYLDLVKKYPIAAMEDPFSQEDWQGWKMLSSRLSSLAPHIFVIGDDFLVTNTERIKKAIQEKACNALVLKPNQIGTVTEAIEAAKLAKSVGWKIFVKHRGGDTNDDFIADLRRKYEKDSSNRYGWSWG